MKITDVHTINALKNGNTEQFEQLFRTYYPPLCMYAGRFVNREEDAEEIVQELFFQLWQKRHDLRIHTSLKAYLYRATYTGCMDKIRKNKVRQAYQQQQVKQQEKGYEDHSIESGEVDRIIVETLNTLPETVKKIFRMSRFEGLKYREIATQLSISVKTVEANMAKALKLFRNNLKDYVGLFL